jgi:predicted RNA polymerase sigma factor
MTAGPTHPQARTSKQPQDTVAGCRDRAEADLLASVAVVTANERARLETSAASWSARASMLQRLDDNHEARKAKAASAIGEDEASPIRI